MADVVTLRRTTHFLAWLDSLSDARAVAKIATRLDRVALGNFGDVAAVGDGVSELRIHYGPGYRLYFMRVGATAAILLCGGDKSTQPNDIRMAKSLARSIRDEH